MYAFQPWRDTVTLLAGARLPRRAHTGERFERKTPPGRKNRTRRRLRVLLRRMRF